MKFYIPFSLLLLINSHTSLAVFEFQDEFNALDEKEKQSAFHSLYAVARMAIKIDKGISETEEVKKINDIEEKEHANPLAHCNICPLLSYENPMDFLQLVLMIIQKSGFKIKRLNPLMLIDIQA